MEEKFTCPKGHTLPFSEFHATIKVDVPDIDDAVVFECPGGARGHHFTLRQAVVGKMFTPEQGKNIANSASLQKRIR